MIDVPQPAPAVPLGQDIPLAVVYEDKDLIVIDKPAGLVVHPAAGNPDGTLVNALIAHCGEFAHRASAAWRGRASSTASTRTPAGSWSRPRTSAPWRASPSSSPTTRSSAPITPWSGAARDSATASSKRQIGRNPFDRKRMGVLRGGGKEAVTRYRVIERYGERPIASLIECRLETGRTHQIRVHLTHIGHPLIGDASYGRARQAPRAKDPAEAAAFRSRLRTFRDRRCTPICWVSSTPACTRRCASSRNGRRTYPVLIEALRGLKIP